MSEDSTTRDYLDLTERLSSRVGNTEAALLAMGNSIERAADRIATSIDNLELVIRTKKPEGL